MELLRSWLALFCLVPLAVSSAFTLSSRRRCGSALVRDKERCRKLTEVASSNGNGEDNFYDDFEGFIGNGGDADEDDKNESEINSDDFAKFRSQMSDMVDDDDDDDDDDDLAYESEGAAGADEISSVDDLIKFATGSSSDEKILEWAKPVLINDDLSNVKGGTVLVANPAMFCSDFEDLRPGANSDSAPGGGMLGNMLGGFAGGGNNAPSPALLAKFGLTLPPPADLGPDRRADLLPVLLVLERHPLKGCLALLLNRRTGYLLGDLESQADGDDIFGGGTASPKLGSFMIQPLWFGGTSAASNSGGKDEGGISQGGGLGMLHMCSLVGNAKKLTDDGMYWGGDPGEAQSKMNDPSLDEPLTGFDFKFFVQCTRWLPMQLEKEIQNGTWFVASSSKEILFKSRDRLGSKRAKPLWTELMERMGGYFKRVRDQLYGE